MLHDQAGTRGLYSGRVGKRTTNLLDKLRSLFKGKHGWHASYIRTHAGHKYIYIHTAAHSRAHACIYTNTLCIHSLSSLALAHAHTRSHARVHTHARTRTHTHTHTHTRTHARTHARTHTHTHTPHLQQCQSLEATFVVAYDHYTAGQCVH